MQCCCKGKQWQKWPLNPDPGTSWYNMTQVKDTVTVTSDYFNWLVCVARKPLHNETFIMIPFHTITHAGDSGHARRDSRRCDKEGLPHKEGAQEEELEEKMVHPPKNDHEIL